MNDSMRSVILGATTLVAAIGLSVLLLRFGELEQWTEPRYVVTVRTDRAEGLRPGSTVELNGVPVGEVQGLTISDDMEFHVAMTVLIHREVAIRSGAVPYSKASMLGGSSILEISPGLGDPLPRDGTGTIRAPISLSVVEQISSELDARMRPFVEAVDRFNALAEEYTELGRNVNALIDPTAPTDGSRPNIRTAIARVDAILSEAQRTMAVVRAFAEDEQVVADARAAVAGARALAAKTDVTLDRVAAAATALEEETRNVSARLMPVADQIGSAAEEVRGVASDARNGDGTVSRLLNDPTLYRDLDDAAIRLEEALRELRLLAERIRKEGIPIDL